MKRALLLINGSAGKMNMEKHVYRIIETLAVNGYETTVYPIIPDKGIFSEDILERAAASSSGPAYDLVVCGGGDGTLNHVINGLMAMPKEKRPVLGYIPAGSTNDFAKSIHIPEEIGEACEVLTGGMPFPYDIGCFNEKYFNYIAAFGAFSEISYSTDQNFKNVFGHAAYILNGLANLQENIGYKCHMRIETDGKIREDDYVFGAVYSATSVGGFPIRYVPDVRLDDGAFEMVLIKAPGNITDLNKIVQALTARDFDSPYLSFTKVKEVKIHAERPVGWTLDGEFGGELSDTVIRVENRAMTIMVKKPEM
ncbi:MAG: YegS/Rv2252/BmrU family lipid kinase [Lachnospiraceae bacterium]|nr:YegS/Rv2252/BmrU family lipid kinase [Lachnospiraceae bacterium]